MIKKIKWKYFDENFICITFCTGFYIGTGQSLQTKALELQ